MIGLGPIKIIFINRLIPKKSIYMFNIICANPSSLHSTKK